MKNIFDVNDKNAFIERINQLGPDTPQQWGKMNVGQMLAHCNVAYEMIYEPGKHKKPGAFARFMLKLFVKNTVVGAKSYKRNGTTAPAFLIKDSKEFEAEKTRMIDYLNRTCELGEAHFEGKESHSFGPLSVTEWNNMLSKHLEHHLTQFGV